MNKQKILNKHYHRIMGLDDENYYFIFQGENTSWGGFSSGIPDMQVKIFLMHPAKWLGDAHAKAPEYSIHSWPMCFGGRGVSDDGKMANHHFGSILGLLLFEYISICEITLKVWLKSLDWQNGKMAKWSKCLDWQNGKMAKWANCFKQKSMGQILNQKRC